jgi:hypothetical protein
MPKDIDQMSAKEIEEAIKKGYEEQDVWLKRCTPNLLTFIPKDWKECISEENNPYYQQCRELLQKEMENNKNFYDAFIKSVASYADRHGTSRKNGEQYILEEISWIYSLPLMHLNKYIYLIHVGNDNPAIKEMFKIFSNLNKAVKWLSPRLKEFSFKNEADFLLHYNVNSYFGYSYSVGMKNITKDLMGRL